MSDSFFSIFPMIMELPVSKQLKTLKLKYFFICYLCYYFHLRNCFKAKLSGVLTAPNFHPRLKSTEDLLRSDIIPAVSKYSLQLWKTCHTQTAEGLLRKAEIYELDRDKFQYVLENGSVALIEYQYKFNMMASKQYVYAIEYNLCPLIIRVNYVFKRDIPILLTMNRVLRAVREGGLIYKWYSDLKQVSFWSDFPKRVVLTISHLQGAFFILITGYGISLLIFIGELFIQHISN